MAAPCVEIPVDPAPRRKGRQDLLRVAPRHFVHGHRPALPGGGEPRVEGVEKIKGVVFEELPGVLAVENDENRNNFV